MLYKANKHLYGLPEKKGLYDPQFENDSCGVGLVANVKGVPSREIMDDAFLVNSKMDHRGGCGFEENTGDGAGILIASPDSFFQSEAEKLDIKLPEKGQYAVGNIFLPTLKKERNKCIEVIEKITRQENQIPIGWREVPVDPEGANVGPASKDAQPFIAQYFIAVSYTHLTLPTILLV